MRTWRKCRGVGQAWLGGNPRTRLNRYGRFSTLRATPVGAWQDGWEVRGPAHRAPGPLSGTFSYPGKGSRTNSLPVRLSEVGLLLGEVLVELLGGHSFGAVGKRATEVPALERVLSRASFLSHDLLDFHSLPLDSRDQGGGDEVYAAW